MELTHLNIADLKISDTNVRKHGKASIAKTVDDLIPSIRSLGVLQPLLVRPDCEGYEIIAGQRRFHACTVLAAEDERFAELPCMIMDAGDDVTAIEASLAENVARLPMDEVDQYKAFAALVRAGKSVEDIASQFGVTERLVTQRLAIANLIGPILTAYRTNDIDPGTVRILTMASKSQQKRWIELHRSDDVWAPTGRALKHWLFGGATIPVSHALFDVDASGLAVIGDLFGEDRYFADSEAFWPLQSAKVAELAEGYRTDGWQNVVVHDAGQRWDSWNYEQIAKEDGGEVHIVTASDGEVSIHAGVLDRDMLRKRQRAEASGEDKPARPEITKAMQRYIDLHRHAAVRTELLGHPGIALRLAVAQMIAGSDLWRVEAEGQNAPDALAESLNASSAEVSFAAEREAIRTLLGIEGENAATIVPRKQDWQVNRDLHSVFAKLVTLSDEDVTRILTFVTAETLAAGTAMTDTLGIMMGTDMATHWRPDDAFFDLMRDKDVINAMLKEVGGKRVADGNATSTAKIQKNIIRDYLSGTRSSGTQGWQPRYMTFPMQAYTQRGSIEAIDNWNTVKHHHA